MPLRPCIDCGRLSDATRCPKHRAAKQRARDQRRGSSSARGYNGQHQRERAAWVPVVDAGMAHCARCGGWIQPGEPWALDHTDDRSGYLGPSHKRCNDAAGGRLAHRSPEPQKNPNPDTA